MSNYILLIMHSYNEKEYKKFKPKKWVDFFKENKKVTLFLFIAFIAFIFAATISIKNKHLDIFTSILFIAFGIFLATSVHMSDKDFKSNYKKRMNNYNMRLELLRDVLKYEFKLYEQKKIEELIKQCDSSIEFYELSTKLSKPLITLTRSVFVPIIAFSFGLISKKIEMSVNDIIQIALLVLWVIIMFWVLFQGIKHHIENFLDGESIKIKKLKGMLNDMLIKDFMKNENKKSDFELYSTINN
ncbi:hypothetical protein [Clostridium beijerinckii]|uniref:hypothetical protein n=1 Tax=Clostridium beijerinckii TaxID=1520 RepID=UPI00242DD314|nr:hypothetical protein [Clostridium beijerinckii]MDG5856533.1 hypothetical protein [Clostridium beijerinckii]